MKIFVCACEASGDLYATLYLKQRKDKKLSIVGVGGDQLKKFGAKIFLSIEQFSIFGFKQGLIHGPGNLKLYRTILARIRDQKPDIFMPVAYPGLNLLLARACRKLNIKVIYLLPPQIWAWGNFRKYFVKKYTDLVVSFFPFEADYYKNFGIKTQYVKNPLVDYLWQFKYLKPDRFTIGLMPGSRPSQIEKHLPLMIKIAEGLKFRIPSLRFKLILLPECLLKSQLPPWLEVVLRERHYAMAKCNFIVLSSGTASLEAGLLGIPHIFIYKPSLLDLITSFFFVRIKEYNLVNIIMNTQVVPVFISPQPEIIIEKVLEYISNPLEQIKNHLLKLEKYF